MNHTNPKLGPLLKALVAALLFGASAPLAKALLQDVAPIPLAALLYLGCGAGALLMALVLRSRNGDEAEAPLATNDLPWLAGAIIAGGSPPRSSSCSASRRHRLAQPRCC